MKFYFVFMTNEAYKINFTMRFNPDDDLFDVIYRAYDYVKSVYTGVIMLSATEIGE